MDPLLNERWSSRRASIEARRRVLAKAFQSTHGRPPSPIESIQLAQQATLETREAKHAPRTLAEQRAAWSRQAREVLGGNRAVESMIASALNPAHRASHRVDAAWVSTPAVRIRDTLQASRSHWQRWHVQAEALRQVRGVELDTADVDRVVGLLVDEVLTTHSVPLTRSGDSVEVPDSLRRSDGSSVYTVTGSQLFTSPDLLAAEARIVARAGQHDGMVAPSAAVDLAMLSSTANGLPLNAGQAAPGPRDGHLRRPPPAGDRPRWLWQDHGHASPCRSLDRSRRDRSRVGPPPQPQQTSSARTSRPPPTPWRS